MWQFIKKCVVKIYRNTYISQTKARFFQYFVTFSPVSHKKNAGDPCRMIQEAFARDSLTKSESDKMFKEGRENVTDEACFGRPTTSRGVDTVAHCLF